MDNKVKTILLIILLTVLAIVLYITITDRSTSAIDRKIFSFEQRDVDTIGTVVSKLVAINYLSSNTNTFLETYSIENLDVFIRKAKERSISVVIVKSVYSDLPIEKYYTNGGKLIAFVEQSQTSSDNTKYYIVNNKIFAKTVNNEKEEIDKNDDIIKNLSNEIVENYNFIKNM